MKTIIILLLMICCLSGCKTRLICKQVYSAQIDYLPICNISFQFNRCQCRCFDINRFKTVKDKNCGKDFKSEDHDITYCDGLLGFHTHDWAIKIKPNIKKLHRIKKDYCK